MKNKVLIFKDIKNKRWTIWDEHKKKHIGYADEIFLENCQFIVIEEKRQKILKSNKRFPHAWVLGEISSKKHVKKNEISYNPFLSSCFLEKEKPVFKRNKLIFDSNGKLYSAK